MYFLSWLLLFLLLIQTSEVQKAEALIQNGDYRAATDYLRNVLQHDPGNHRILKLLAKASILDGDRSAAEEMLERLTRLTPDDAESWSLLGRLYQDSNQFTRALEPLQRALKINPIDVATLTSLANTQVGLGEYEQALSTFKRAVGLNKKVVKPLALPHASFAIFLLRLNRVSDAQIEIRKAEQIDPNSKMMKEAQRALALRFKSVDNMPSDSASAILGPPQFVDLAIAAGIDFRLENSPSPFKHQIETMPGGVAVLDYDQDGLMDIYFTNGAESPSLKKTGPRYWNRLYRNVGNGRFADVTEKAGVAGVGYAMGAAAADFDNDGFPDLFVVGVNRNILYRNNGDGTFTDITDHAGLQRPHPRYGTMWSIHATWFDYDNDGWLDLFVVNYCVWDPVKEPYCGQAKPGFRSYCHPNRYDPLPNQLFRNNHDGTFTDVSEQSGVGKYLGKGMGAAIADFDADGRIDIFVANDTEPNFLFWNRGGGRFEEVALAKGVAVNQFGSPVSSMGVDFRDVDNDGRPDLFVTTLSNEVFLLFRNHGNWFDDSSDAAGISLASFSYSGWSNAIVDLNNDGWKDLFSSNGHAIDNIELTQSRSYRQPNVIFKNNGDGTFTDVTSRAGKDISRAAAHRGAAVADFDNDGKMDLVVTALGDRAELFRNVTAEAGNWLLVRTIGARSNRDGIGAVLRLETGDGRTLWNHVTSSVGFASSSDPRVHFGLGKNSSIRSLEITWPSGQHQKLTNIRANQILTIRER